MKLVVGLGNPGTEYANTRHNIGFDVIDRLAEKLGWVPTGGFDRMARNRFESLTFDGVIDTAIGQEKLLLIKPTTFMNLSGRSVQAAISFYQLSLGSDVMVILDDLALPCGKLRIRGSGSSGGHNGLKDIEKMLGTNAYPRLRVGIDAPPEFVPGRDYVLGKWSTEQKKLITPAIDRACSAILTWADVGLEKAMSQFNAVDKD